MSKIIKDGELLQSSIVDCPCDPLTSQSSAIDLFFWQSSFNFPNETWEVYPTLEEAGAELSECIQKTHGRFIAGSLIPSSETILRSLVQYPEIAEGNYFHPCIKELAKKSTKASSCGLLALAVLSRSETALISALRLSSSNVNERNVFAQTPLHLAIGWPFAVEQLLKAGADANAVDCQGNSVIYVACEVRSTETVHLLLASGCAIFGRELDNPFSQYYRDALEAALHDGPIFDIILSEVRRRSTRLLEMARQHLSKETLQQFHPGDGWAYQFQHHCCRFRSQSGPSFILVP